MKQGGCLMLSVRHLINLKYANVTLLLTLW